ncbi:MAG: phosphoribosylanthranilate isomerase [Syntrophorhabdales bacterium]|jgi:phosphoribosylanthranilate isomerase
MVRIKFCGMTNLDDCRRAADLPVDFAGFVFYRGSKRAVTPLTARRIIEGLDGKVRTVGVFVEETDREMEEIVGYCGLDFAQVYRESALPNTIRVVRVGARPPRIPSRGLILFDSDTAGLGGSGTSFDPGLLRGCDALGRAFVAGGIGEGNVEDVLLRLRPFGVDLVSSIEAAPGRKDHKKMERFVEKVRGLAI